MNEYKEYIKTAVQKMRPYVPGEDLTGVSVSERDTPEEGGMIAKGSDDGAKWYVSKNFFKENYQLVGNIKKSKGDLFVEHISSHLNYEDDVVCMICGKTVDEIALETKQEG